MTANSGKGPMERQSTGWMLGLTGIVLLSGLMLSWLFSRTQEVTPQAHYDYLNELRNLREADAGVNAQLLASRLEITRNYDALTRQIGNALASRARLETVPGFLSRPQQLRIQASAKALEEEFATKARLVESFKRDMAAMRNSLAFFPVLADSLLLRDFSGKQAVETYARHIMAFAREPGKDRLERIAALRTQLAGMSFPADKKPAIASLLRHGDVIEHYLPRVNELTRAAVNLRTVAHLEQLNREYLLGHASALRTAGYYRVMLYGLAMLLMAYLTYTFLKLDRVRRSLIRAHREISERFAAQQSAEAKLLLHATAFQNAHEGITLTDAKGNIVDINPAFSRITGFERNEVIGLNPRILKSGRQDDSFYAAMWKSIAEKGSWRGEIWNRNKYGEVFPELLSISEVRDDSGAVSNYVSVFSDISQLKEQEKQLTQLAYYDALTDLPNRVLLVDRMNQGMSQSRRVGGSLMAVCYLDLDGFKLVNDTWGHLTGDRLLVEMAQRLHGSLRGGDTVARLGGDEFVLLLDLYSVKEVHQTMQRLLNAISQPLLSTPTPISLSASIGVTLYPADESDPDTLLRHADQAMYLAKQAGKNTYHVFDPDQDRSTRGRIDTVKRMGEALERNEFVLHYQPKVNMRVGKVVGLEALIRWQHPERGLMLPGEFMPLVEKHDLIITLGRWAIETALEQMEKWCAEGLDLTVSVNVSGHQLQNSDFVKELGDILTRHPDVGGRLELEVLETTALSDMVKVSRVIEECSALGVSFALDDFGTGYSSLAYLKRLPADTIKIDQSFVREILRDPHNLAIVQGILGLASAFQRTVIAEGVENLDHGRLLLQLGCDLAQGHGISRPIPGDEVREWVATWQPAAEWADIRDLRWERDDIPILIAEVDHRCWIYQLIYAIREGQPPPHADVGDDHACRFGGWYFGAGTQRYQSLPSFKEVGLLHERIHIIAAEIDQHWRNGRHDLMRNMVSELSSQQEVFLKVIRQLQIEVAVPN